MKKTLTVNLGGTVFHIDEDAYQLLDKYLSNLRIHFRKEEGSEEIMNDFEMRISELFGERIRLGHEVITIEHVEEVINRMGKPEEIFEEEETEEEKENAKKRVFQEQVITGKKKLMRAPANRVIGGVAAGIAAYMGWDATAVRLAMILLLFIPVVHWMALLYIILWMVMPVRGCLSRNHPAPSAFAYRFRIVHCDCSFSRRRSKHVVPAFAIRMGPV